MIYLFIFFGLTSLGVGVYLLSKFLKNVQPSSAEVLDDVEELRADLSKWRGGFAPWSKELLDLLGPTPQQVDHIVNKGQVTTAKGVIVTSAGEPLMAYSYKKYIAPGMNAVLYVANSEHEYVFRYTNKGTEVMIDGMPLGSIRKDGGYYSTNGTLLAQAAQSSQATALLVGEKKLAILPAAANTTLSTEIATDLTPIESNLVESFLAYQLTQRVVSKI